MNDKELVLWLAQKQLHYRQIEADSVAREAGFAKRAVQRLMKERDEARRVAKALAGALTCDPCGTAFEDDALQIALAYPDVK